MISSIFFFQVLHGGRHHGEDEGVRVAAGEDDPAVLQGDQGHRTK